MARIPMMKVNVQNSEESPGKDMEFSVVGVDLQNLQGSPLHSMRNIPELPIDIVATAEFNIAWELSFRCGNVSNSESPCGKLY